MSEDQKRTTRKIVWALDAFKPQDELNENTLSVLKTLSSDQEAVNVEIHPVSVLYPGEVSRLASTLELTWIKESAKKVKANLRDALQEVDFPGLQEAQVIPHAGTARSQAIEAFADYAKQIGANLVVMNTHARKGLERFFLGSFAESFLLETEIPTLVINPKTRKIEKIERILFPTDFSETCWEAFQETVSFAKEHEASVLLYHSLQSTPAASDPVYVTPVI